MPRYLTEDEIDAIRDAAIHLGLARARETLLSGLPAEFSMSLLIAGTPAEQLQSDLQRMNTTTPLEDEEHTIPLQRWLSTAYQLHKIRGEARVFKAALDKIRAATAAPVAVQSASASASPFPRVRWPAKLSGADAGELCDALLDAFRERASLSQMLWTRLNLRLEEIAGASNQRTTMFEIISHAESRGIIPQLFEAAVTEVPGNPMLRAFADKRRG
ncbi:MAG: effector-associated domain EAD1-containing protein [Minicystis sp.]